MKQSVGVCLISMSLFGCTTWPVWPVVPVLPDGRAKVTLNNPSAIAQTMSDYYRGQSERKAKAEPPRVLARMTISQIVDKFVPADFRVYAADGVALETVVDYDAARPWVEAFGKPLLDAGIEMTANLEQKTMMLRPGVTTIEQVLNRQVPDDYTVYADESVQLGQAIKFDRAKPWLEALGKALAAVGVSMTANVDKRMIVLKPVTRSKIVRFKDNGALAALPRGVQSYAGASRDGAIASNPSNN